MLSVEVEKTLGEFRISVRFAGESGATGLFGPSGSGKTSIINMIAGLMTPDRGRITLGDLVLFDTPDGGLAFWVRFRDAAVLERIERNAADAGIRFAPPESYAVPPAAEKGLRLGFASLTEGEADEALTRLRAASVA